MAKLVAFYSRADENYFGGTKKYISEGKLEAYDFSARRSIRSVRMREAAFPVRWQILRRRQRALR